jgi:hypothetical protein
VISDPFWMETPLLLCVELMVMAAPAAPVGPVWSVVSKKEP